MLKKFLVGVAIGVGIALFVLLIGWAVEKWVSYTLWALTTGLQNLMTGVN